jgi:hypothetical protein
LSVTYPAAECGHIAVEGADPPSIDLVHRLDARQTEVGEIILRDVQNRETYPVLKAVKPRI